MSRKEKGRGARTARLHALLEEGDHRGVRGAARAILAEPAAAAEDRAAAEDALRSIRPEPTAVWVGGTALAGAVAILAWTVLRG